MAMAAVGGPQSNCCVTLNGVTARLGAKMKLLGVSNGSGKQDWWRPRTSVGAVVSDGKYPYENIARETAMDMAAAVMRSTMNNGNTSASDRQNLSYAISHIQDPRVSNFGVVVESKLTVLGAVYAGLADAYPNRDKAPPAVAKCLKSLEKHIADVGKVAGSIGKADRKGLVDVHGCYDSSSEKTIRLSKLIEKSDLVMNQALRVMEEGTLFEHIAAAILPRAMMAAIADRQPSMRKVFEENASQEALLKIMNSYYAPYNMKQVNETKRQGPVAVEAAVLRILAFPEFVDTERNADTPASLPENNGDAGRGPGDGAAAGGGAGPQVMGDNIRGDRINSGNITNAGNITTKGGKGGSAYVDFGSLGNAFRDVYNMGEEGGRNKTLSERLERAKIKRTRLEVENRQLQRRVTALEAEAERLRARPSAGSGPAAAGAQPDAESLPQATKPRGTRGGVAAGASGELRAELDAMLARWRAAHPEPAEGVVTLPRATPSNLGLARGGQAPIAPAGSVQSEALAVAVARPSQRASAHQAVPAQEHGAAKVATSLVLGRQFQSTSSLGSPGAIPVAVSSGTVGRRHVKDLLMPTPARSEAPARSGGAQARMAAPVRGPHSAVFADAARVASERAGARDGVALAQSVDDLSRQRTPPADLTAQLKQGRLGLRRVVDARVEPPPSLSLIPHVVVRLPEWLEQEIAEYEESVSAQLLGFQDRAGRELTDSQRRVLQIQFASAAAQNREDEDALLAKGRDEGEQIEHLVKTRLAAMGAWPAELVFGRGEPAQDGRGVRDGDAGLIRARRASRVGSVADETKTNGTMLSMSAMPSTESEDLFLEESLTIQDVERLVGDYVRSIREAAEDVRQRVPRGEDGEPQFDLLWEPLSDAPSEPLLDDPGYLRRIKAEFLQALMVNAGLEAQRQRSVIVDIARDVLNPDELAELEQKMDRYEADAFARLQPGRETPRFQDEGTVVELSRAASLRSNISVSL